MQSNKQLAAGQRRKLERIKSELIEMAAQWEDRDNYLVSALNAAADDLDKTKNAIEVDNEN
jgi:hypothetical protein